MTVALLGGSGVAGVLIWLFKRYLERKLTAGEAAQARQRDFRERRFQLESELQHAYGRMFYWLYRAIRDGQANGDLEKAFVRLETAEEALKALDRAELAHTNNE